MGEEGVSEYLYKVLVVGDMGTGKTAIIRRYVNNMYSDSYKSTIGVDFALKEINWDSKTLVRLQLWDIAGQERYGNMTRVYYKEAVGAFVVFDITRNSSFEAVKKWKQDIDSKVTLHDQPIPVVLLANKCDLVKNPCNEEVMNEYCREHGFAAWFTTSAKENVNVDEAVTALVSAISKRTGGTGGAAAAPAPSQQQENIKVAGGQPAADNKSSDCSC
ncbi:lightoid family protein [Acanthamoeba castellanii str. Neff]|uniref:Ras-related protein Rab n=1 Tax=Acanthamoeba castellanii (strain ATCC 30010 / Neff) TaxID=1257118 RepID=L8HHC7_ACACF|nr:lightoid family protein [Acanthamoeba castellanii str. Neff]ELR24994.1 lightoid family protein [Acanthamoeba castellanii str. Neff]